MGPNSGSSMYLDYIELQCNPAIQILKDWGNLTTIFPFLGTKGCLCSHNGDLGMQISGISIAKTLIQILHAYLSKKAT